MKFRESFKKEQLAHSEAKELLEEELDFKIEFMKKIFHEAEAKAESLSAEDFSDWCNQKFLQISIGFPEDAQKYEQYADYTKRRKELQHVSDVNTIFIKELLSDYENRDEIIMNLEMGTFYNEEEDFRKFLEKELENYPDELSEELINLVIANHNIENESEDLWRKIEFIEKENSNIHFIRNIKSFFESVKSKKNIVSQEKKYFEEHPLDAKKRLISDEVVEKVGDEEIDEKISIKFEGIHVLIYVDQSIWRGKHALGFNFSGTPYSFIKTGNFESKDTEKHEKNHNLFDTLDTHTYIYHDVLISIIKKRIKEHVSMRGLKIPPLILDTNLKSIKDRISDYYKELSAELLADTDRIIEGKTGGFSGHFRNTVRELHKMSNEVDDPELKKVVKEATEEVQRKFEFFLVRINNLLFVAQKFDQVEELRMLLLLFPRNPEKIERYMKSKHGDIFGYLIWAHNFVVKKSQEEELVEMIFGLKEKEIFAHSFSPDELSKFAMFSGKVDKENILSDEEIKNIRRNIINQLKDLFGFFGLVLKDLVLEWGIEDVYEYLGNMETILKHFDLEVLKENEVEESLLEYFVYKKVDQAISENSVRILDDVVSSFKNKEEILKTIKGELEEIDDIPPDFEKYLK